MPGLPFAQLPGGTQYKTALVSSMPAQPDPFDMIRQQKNELWETYSRLEGNLRDTSMTDEAFSQQINKLQGSYATEFEKIKQLENQMTMVQQMVDQGQLTPEDGTRAVTNLAVPFNIRQAISGAEKPDTPFSAASLVSDSFTGTIGEFAKEARVDSRWWPGKKYGKDELMKQYLGWREFIGYDNLAPVRKRQVDLAWDDEMKTIGIDEWNSDDPNIKRLRSYGRLQRAAGIRSTPGKRPVTIAEDIAGRIKRPVRSESKAKRLDRETARMLVKEIGGDPDNPTEEQKRLARQLAKKREYTF